MLGSLFQILFRCSHKRLTRPITSVKRPGVSGGETTVVCLECGRQFAYDWDHMRIGKPIEPSHDSGVLHPDTPGPAKTRVKYALIGSAVPFAVILGKALAKKRRAAAIPRTAAGEAALSRRIVLPRDEAGFYVSQLIEYMERSGRDYIIEGAVDCALADHPQPRSLDYWLRENFARNKDTRHATREVITQLLAAGLFEERDDLRCPDTGERTRGLRLIARE